jgi:hypothetical protein
MEARRLARPGRLAPLALALLLPGSAAAEDGFTRSRLSIGGGEIELSIESAEGGGPSRPEVERWVRRAAVAVSTFYGRFPVARLRVVVSRFPGRGIHGTAYHGRLVRMRVGSQTPAERLATDWTMTHELFHIGFPDLDERHLWMQEGLSTYFEPIARARVGDMPAAQVWRELFRDLPQGLPRAEDRGLDRTPTWAATYWGGALFWFMADIEIRERTRNHHSADDALRAILRAGGDGSKRWPIERILQVGDRATGTTVLATLYRKSSRRRLAVDLPALAARLGVIDGRLDDRAPLAAIRRSITARPAPRR